MTDTLHPQIATLLELYRRDLRRTAPSNDLDARVGDLVAGRSARPAAERAAAAARRRGRMRPLAGWAAAAGVGALAIFAGIVIGIRMEHGAQLAKLAATPVSPPADFSMWPRDSVALQIPAEYSQGSLVAVDPRAAVSGKRYWIDVVVSNDGTVRIDQIVPADSKNISQGSHDGITLQNP